MSLNLDAIFEAGGKRLIDFLDYSVRSGQMDALFLFLVGEYRRSPTTAKAVMLYDLFCARDAPARVSAHQFLPPRNVQLDALVRPARAHWIQAQVRMAQCAPPLPVFLPPKYLFDAIAGHLRLASPDLRR